jgi:hypothetical protein
LAMEGEVQLLKSRVTVLENADPVIVPTPLPEDVIRKGHPVTVTGGRYGINITSKGTL